MNKLNFIFSIFGLIILFFPILFSVIIILIVDRVPPFFFQERVGLNKKKFNIIKLRTMKTHINDSLPTHEINYYDLTLTGKFLRKFKLDEIPQLLNVLKGEMSLVGPRPCLPNQYDLINEREKKGVFKALPGITGLAQIEGIDMSNPELLALTDAKMLKDLDLKNYFKYIFLTLIGRGSGDHIS